MRGERDIEVLEWKGYKEVVTGTDSISKTPGARARVPLLRAGQALFRRDGGSVDEIIGPASHNRVSGSILKAWTN
ncbi:hypothetical protein EVAR_19775_1 [Eumeta japonica]|uniref:Uncharacterized protein n=1 Tax=Eumeta variegata TaxID=151549 RepID=A0A4C1UQI6_EUMVA|nr:hypothetical protein EVAR_19775_1 [Eumeta japonica]